MQNQYPIFESGQVLTSKHLNDLANYLAEQDRLTRSQLIGIGIVCGLDVDYPPEEDHLHISAGIAVTSTGHLIVQAEGLFSRYRVYTPPTPEFEEIPDDLPLPEESPYPFFLDTNGNPIQLWELVEAGYVPMPGEPATTAIDHQFLADKVVLLFLESVQSALKSCDLNDCSDKGAQQAFTVRRLLVRKSDAQAMLAMEEEIAGFSVDRSKHPKFDLHALTIEKLNPAGNGLTSLAELFFRVLAIAQTTGPEIATQFDLAYRAYAHFLKDIYPEADYPNGPFVGTGIWLNGLKELAQNIFLFQYYYDLLYDLIQSHNEFLAEAFKLEAECCPNSERFPQHVLLGPVTDQPTAFTPPGPGNPVDPLSLDTGFGAAVKPIPFRHHFISSPLFDRRHERLQRVRSLHYRTFLLAFRYQTDGLLKKAVRITPGRDGDVPLSQKAIPFYYAFKSNDDLHRNWSFDATTGNGLARVHAYPFTTRPAHPLLLKHGGHNFYRVEGIIGKGLGEAMGRLVTQKKALGLSFGIEPVYLGLGVNDDLSSLALDKEVQARAKQAVFRVLMCRFSDLDAVFLILIMTLFYFLVVIIALLSGLGAGSVGMLPRGTARKPAEKVAADASRFLKAAFPEVDLPLEKDQADALLFEIRKTPYAKGWVTGKVRPPKGKEISMGMAYEEIIKDGSGEENLYDRTLKYAKTLNLEARVEDVADNLYKTVSLIDHSEDLIGVVGVDSIGGMDFNSFERKYGAFEAVYDDYLAHAAAGDTKNSPEIAAAQQLLAFNRSQMTTGGSVTLINSMMKEFNTRMQKIFSELLLGGYAGRHPGLEHKCGVPVGGTLVLLYTHRNLIRQVLGKNKEKIDIRMGPVFDVFGAKDSRPTIKDPMAALEERKPAGDPMDDFVVLGDFSSPYLCCDTDCSDLILENSGPDRPSDDTAVT